MASVQGHGAMVIPTLPFLPESHESTCLGGQPHWLLGHLSSQGQEHLVGQQHLVGQPSF